MSHAPPMAMASSIRAAGGSSERRGQTHTKRVSAEGADDCAHDAGEVPTEDGAVRRPDCGTADRAAQ